MIRNPSCESPNCTWRDGNRNKVPESKLKAGMRLELTNDFILDDFRKITQRAKRSMIIVSIVIAAYRPWAGRPRPDNAIMRYATRGQHHVSARGRRHLVFNGVITHEATSQRTHKAVRTRPVKLDTAVNRPPYITAAAAGARVAR
ncbi:hypothetical protein EVAR_93489_1 [Eumeta japonica]|uniref:Uncharacterized protein n=1 Tax=Eumeta variegata TaxID=151549 RepID=A0A4C1TMF0_EUMVA|nr:hypothetical protein EVAR_93489_1 [Eumeta japonica]